MGLLCLQQFEVIKVYTNLRVGMYYGAMRVDDWTLKSWEKEINDHDVSLLLKILNLNISYINYLIISF